jgi:tripeptidyl-peptidase-1
VVLESLSTILVVWKKLRDADPKQILKLRIALEQPRIALSERIPYDTSTPRYLMYGHRLDKEGLRDKMKPLEEPTTTVLSWLPGAGTPSSQIEDDGEWISFWTTVAQAELMLNTHLTSMAIKGQGEETSSVEVLYSRRDCA